MASTGSRNVLIHVFDEHRKTTKDFICRRDVLLEKMRYFRAYLNQANELDEIDISVHCDAEIFEWLVEYMQRQESEWKERITLDNIASVLVSSEFLQMDALVDECVTFISGHMQDFVQLRVDFGCLSENVISMIAGRCDAELLQQLHDPKDKILSKLFCKKVESILQEVKKQESELCSCVNCGIIYLKIDEKRLHCARGTRRVTVRGELLAAHQATPSWTPEDWVKGLVHERGSIWGVVFWILWASMRAFHCSHCKRYCSFLEFDKCPFHPGLVIGVGVEARFACCGARIFLGGEFDGDGCKTRDHILCSGGAATLARNMDLLKMNWASVTSIIDSEPARQVEQPGMSMATLGMLSVSEVVNDTTTKRLPPPTANAVSPRRRQQWLSLGLQEQDRVRIQSTLKQLSDLRT